MNKVAFINDKAHEIQDGETILNFIRRHLGKNYIPTLCDNPLLEPFGSCRLCSVEVARAGNGALKTVAACHTPVSEGVHIFTDTDSIQRLRRNIVELILTDHPLDCLTCEANGRCELQDVAARVGIREVRYPQGRNHLDRPKDESHTYLRTDLSKCINCYQCVRACDEVQGEFVLSMAGRGFDNHIIKGMDTSFADSYCVSCGACVQACPTAAISDIFQPAAKSATDTVRTVCTYCGVGCNLEVAKRDNTILSISAPTDAAANHGHTCVKGRYAFRFYNHPDRLRSPMIRRNGQLEEVSWNEAYDYIAERLTAIKTEYGPDAIAGISSSRCTNEENYLMQKFIRAVIGTNNIDGCARICHAPTALGMQRTFGTGAATNSIADLQYTDCILVVGANPTTAHPVTGARIKQQAMKGKTLIVVDPRRTELARHATYHLQLRPGTNVALLNMMIYYILKEKQEDQAFIEKRTEGFEELRRNILAMDIIEMENICGVDRKLVREAALAYATAPNAMSFHGLGVTEHYQGTFGVMLVASLAMITGNIGRRGVGVNPLRGQNNVQGAADMGVQPNLGPGYMDVRNPELRQTYEAIYGVSLPSEPGYTIPRMFEAAEAGKLKALWIMGEDVVQTEPNSDKVRAALQQLDLFILQELFYSETASYADVILPAASFFEKSGTFTNGERRIQRVNRVVDPLPGAKPDGEIITDIMNRMGYPQLTYDPATLLEEISQVVPFFRGVHWERLGRNGLQWPVAEDGTDTQVLHTESFKLGKGRLSYISFEESRELEKYGEDYPFILTTNRGLEHYNSGSMTRRTQDTDILGEDLLLIHPEDAQSRSIIDGEKVLLCSARGEAFIRVRVTDMVKPGILSTTFHFPEILVNQITSDVLDSEADCPEYKVVAVDVRKG
ncbi:MAG: formate dehydrogenase subunit alpha [Phaeodactylibacter sp.]|nr:formate dehydrogenase subunit alpha [Phaeodactylibacter sp.]MCB9299962.1 formate dehydrogenase subunit alpha [Lewinellaceae bacterium]